MPYHPNQANSSQAFPPDHYHAATSAAFPSGQSLIPSGAPSTQWSSHPTLEAENRYYSSQKPGTANGNGSIAGTVPLSNPNLGAAPLAYGTQNTLPTISQNSQYHNPRHSLTRPEELRINQNAGSAMSDVHHYGAPPAYGPDGGVSINVHPSTPQHNPGGNPISGSLQPGLTLRPGPMSSNTAPGAVPTLPQISTQMQQPSLSARPSVMSHNYSRSSPSGMDQPKYRPFSNTPDALKYASPTSNYIPQTPQGISSYSPLGLADIRPRSDTLLSEGALSPGALADADSSQYQTSNNYVAPWPIYALDWCKWQPRSNSNSVGKIAIGSYLEDNHNYIQILDAQVSQPNSDDPHAERGLDFFKTAEATHSYPVTRILWEPPSSNKQTTDLLATSGDHLRLWSLPNETQGYQSNSISRSSSFKDQPLQKLSPLALLSNSKSPEHTAPITSLDWNVVSPSLIITSSIDTTCTIWDIPTLTAKTQLIAHDKEVFDVRFCAQSVDVFVSCGADGSVRMFDLRSLEHSTIIYEPSDKQDKNAQLSPDPSASPTRANPNPFPPPLLRIAASPHDAHLLATFSSDSPIIRVLDVRQPGQALLELKSHSASVNCIEWSNTNRGILSSGADDCCVLIWDLMTSGASTAPTVAFGPAKDVQGNPTAAAAGGALVERGASFVWEASVEVGNLSWAPAGVGGQGSILGVAGGRSIWGVQI